MKIRIPYHPDHIALFLLLAFLCYQAHQLVRHLTGAILCRGFGSMSFTVATTRQPCSFPTIVILSGPLLTFGLAWSGMFLLRSRKHALFAYALIFASFAHLRFIQTLSGRGDELVLAQQWLAAPSRAIVAALVFLAGLPPLIAAYIIIANGRRPLVFIGSWLLPLPYCCSSCSWGTNSFLGVGRVYTAGIPRASLLFRHPADRMDYGPGCMRALDLAAASVPGLTRRGLTRGRYPGLHSLIRVRIWLSASGGQLLQAVEPVRHLTGILLQQGRVVVCAQ